MRREPLLATGMGTGGGAWSIDSRVRLLAVLSFAAVVVSLQGWRSLIAATVLAAFAIIVSGPAWRALARQVLAMDGLMLLVLASLPFSVPGEPLWQWGRLSASRDGLLQALAIAAKANAILLMAFVLLRPMSAITLGHALRRLRVPASLTHLLMFTVRYLDVLAAEYARLRRAMTVRAFRPRTDRHTWRTFGWLVGMLLVRSFERAERIEAAMKCRGFTGQWPMIDDLRLRPADGAFAFSGIVALGVIVWLERG